MSGQQRICRLCDQAKDLDAFPKDGWRRRRHECSECWRAHKRAAYKSNEAAESHRRRTYGLDGDAFVDMLVAQRGRCAICYGELGDKSRPHVDHCHKTGKVRAILCSRCNRGLGNVNDNPALLRAMADYIEAHAEVAGGLRPLIRICGHDGRYSIVAADSCTRNGGA